MWGSTNAPGVTGQLAGAVMRGMVETPLTNAEGVSLCTASGKPLTAHQTLRRDEHTADIPAALWPLIYHAIAAEGADIERRTVDSIMGALMAGEISATLTDRSGTALATGRGETITAHQHIENGARHYDSQTAGLFPLFERMTANSIAAR